MLKTIYSTSLQASYYPIVKILLKKYNHLSIYYTL